MGQVQARQKKHAKYEAALGAIRKQFRLNLLNHILLLENSAQSVRNGSADRDDFHRIAACCHKIAGTAPTLGLPDIGARARTIENQLMAIADADQARRVWPIVDPQLEELLDLLEEELDRAED